MPLSPPAQRCVLSLARCPAVAVPTQGWSHCQACVPMSLQSLLAERGHPPPSVHPALRMWRRDRSQWGQWPPWHQPLPGPSGQALVMASATEGMAPGSYLAHSLQKPSHPTPGPEQGHPLCGTTRCPAVFQLLPHGISGFPSLCAAHPGGFVSTTWFKCLISL